MSVTRRSVLQGALAAAVAVVATGTRREQEMPPDSLLIYDSRLPQSRAMQLRHTGISVDVAHEHANRWRELRGLRSGGAVVGLTCWTDLVQVRGLLGERGRRLRVAARRGRLYYWEMA